MMDAEGTGVLVVTVRFQIKPGEDERFFGRVSSQANSSLDLEPGCRRFDVSRNVDDPRELLLYEIYDDVEAFEEHLKSEHFRAFDAETRSWVVKKVVEKWESRRMD